MILFPLGDPIFSGLGPEGISMFYVSCIVAQLVYSKSSIFKGGVGSEMVSTNPLAQRSRAKFPQIEVVPFFHTMAFSIKHRVGADREVAVRATTIAAYAISSILTGIVFYLMGRFKLGALMGFFPRHILIGCMGGIGWFLVATGFEVSARLDGSLTFTLDTLHRLLQPDTVALWVIPLFLAVSLQVIKRWIKNPYLDATFFVSILILFVYFVFAISELDWADLRSRGWVFEAPPTGVPFYHFYTLYSKCAERGDHEASLN